MNAVIQEVCSELGVLDADRAADVYVEQLLNELGIRKWPVPLDIVCAKLGVTKVEYRPISCDGMLIPRANGSYVIFLADWAPPARQRFSLAHELGHAIIHKIVPVTRGFENRSVFMPLGHQAEEQLCDVLASRILMPTSLMMEFATAHEFGIEAATLLSRTSGASLSSATRRLGEVRGIDVALVSVRQCASTYRAIVDRVLCPFRGRKTRLQRGAKLRHGSPATRALERQSVEKGFEWLPSSRTQSIRRFVECEGRWASGADRRGVLLIADREF